MPRTVSQEDLRDLVTVAPTSYQYSMTFDVESELFGHRARIDISSATGDPRIDVTDYVIRCVNMFFALDDTFLARIKTELWKHFEALVSEGGYGEITAEMVAEHGGDERAATVAFFDIADEEAAYRSCTEMLVVMYGGEQEPDLHDGFTIQFSVPWEREHGVVLEVVDGALAEQV